MINKMLASKEKPNGKKVFNPAGRYGPARNAIKDFYSIPRDISVLARAADKIEADRGNKDTREARNNCKINADAIRKYIMGFGERKFKTDRPGKLKIAAGLALVKIEPDLWVTEAGKLKLIKIRFAASPISKKERLLMKTKCAIIYQAQLVANFSLPYSSVFYMDVTSGSIIESKEAGYDALVEFKKTLKRFEQMYLEISEATNLSNQLTI
jgi:hypothetical protein